MTDKTRIDEIEIVQNPCLGGVAIWAAGDSYIKSSSATFPVPLAFVILPMVLHPPIRNMVLSTKKASGFAKVVEKMGASATKELDIVEGINRQSLLLRDLTWRSIRILLRTGLAKLDLKSAGLVTSSKIPPFENLGDVKDLVKAAQKLGFWLSQRSFHENSLMLRVRF